MSYRDSRCAAWDTSTTWSGRTTAFQTNRVFSAMLRSCVIRSRLEVDRSSFTAGQSVSILIVGSWCLGCVSTGGGHFKHMMWTGHRRRRYGGRGHVTPRDPPPKIRKKIFSDNYYVKFWHFGQKSCKIREFCNFFSDKYHKISGIWVLFRARIM